MSDARGQPSTRGSSAVELALAVLCVLAIRMITLGMVETGGDAIEGWFVVKKLTAGLPWGTFDWNHRTVRIGMTGPVFLAQSIFGTDARVYYVAPLSMSLLAAGFLFALARRNFGSTLAWWATLGFALFPQQLSSGCQQTPEIFSCAYLLVAADALDRFRGRRAIRHVAVAALGLWAAYLVKVPNLFFVPGFAVALYLGGGRGKAFGWAAGVLGLGIAAENAWHVLVAGQPLGRVGYIVAGHFPSKALEEVGFWGLFGRFTTLDDAWTALVAAFVVATLVAWWRRQYLHPAIGPWLAIAGSFLVLTTFAVKQLDPIVPAQPFRDRYLTSASPFMILVIAGVAWCVVGPPLRARSAAALARIPTVAVRASVAAIGLFGAFLSTSASGTEHPWRLLAEYQREFHAEFAAGRPIVALGRDRNPLLVAVSLFWDPKTMPNYRTAVPPIRRTRVAGRHVWYVIDEVASGIRTRRRELVQSWVGVPLLEADRILEAEDDEIVVDRFLMRRVTLQPPEAP